MTPSPTPDLPAWPLTAIASVPLPGWGVIRARGADAASFLHGQLTQDMQSLTPETVRLAGYCSAKGRLLASFVVWRPAADEFLLACSADLLGATLKRLSMFVMRAKCQLSDVTAELALRGVVAPLAAAGGFPATAGQALAAGGGQLLRLADAAGCARALWRAPAAAPPPWPATLDAAAWRWLEVQAGVPRIVARTVEAFVPQMINLELVGGVNFQKGCYPGQEIVARSQYRGTLKRRMRLVQLDAAAEAGAEVFAAADPGQPAGQVVLAADWPGAGAWRHAALVELKRNLADGGGLHLGAADGPGLRPAELPYPLPVDDAA